MVSRCLTQKNNMNNTYDLELYALPIDLNCPNLEIYSNRRDKRRCPRVVAEAKE